MFLCTVQICRWQESQASVTRGPPMHVNKEKSQGKNACVAKHQAHLPSSTPGICLPMLLPGGAFRKQANGAFCTFASNRALERGSSHYSAQRGLEKEGICKYFILKDSVTRVMVFQYSQQIFSIQPSFSWSYKTKPPASTTAGTDGLVQRSRWQASGHTSGLASSP